MYNRYPGPKAFTDAEEPSFFGRSLDCYNLFRMISLKKVTVLFGKSGTGKSSLLNAGIIPRFKKEGNYDVKAIRFLLYTKELAGASKDEPYLRKNLKTYFSLPSTDKTFLDKITGGVDSLWLHFKKLQILDENKRGYILILDQFEEIGSYPNDDVKSFLSELNELLNFHVALDFEKLLNKALDNNEDLLSKKEFDLLYEPIKIKLILTIKSEKIGILHSVKNYIGDILQNCYELQPLNRDQAKEAIKEPANKEDEAYYKVARFSYDEKAVDVILCFLEKSGGENNFYENRGIETSMLQIICSHIEQEFASKDFNKDRILSLEEMGKPEDLYKDYYETQINKLAYENSLNDKTKNLVYQFVEGMLITKGEPKYREQVFLENLSSRFNIIKEKKLAEKLVDIGFLRKERKGDERVFYELSHEKLIEPVLAAKLQRENKERKTENVSVAGAMNNNAELSGLNSQTSGFSGTGEKHEIELNEPHDCIRKGDELVSLGDYKKAVNYYNKAIKLDGNYYYSFYRRGSAYILDGEFELAITDFEKALELQPDFYLSHNEIGRCYLRIADRDKAGGHASKANANYYAALDCFNLVIQANTKAQYAYNNAGLIYLRLSKIEESIEYFNNALVADPGYSQSYFNRGLAYGYLKQYELAIRDFDEVIDLEPKAQDAFCNKGTCCYELANTLDPENEAERINKLCADAIDALTEALRLNSNYESALVSRGLCFEKMNSYKQALDDYTTLISINPANQYAWYSRGICNAELKNNNEAIADYTKAIELNSDHSEALFERARIYYLLLKFEEALSDYNRVILLKPDYYQAWYNRGLCKYKLFEDKSAIADFAEALRLSPNDDKAWYYSGVCKYNLADYKAAIDDYTEVIRINTRYYQAWYERGLCKYYLEQYQDAINDYTEAIRIYPEYINAYFERGLTLYSIDRYDDAAKDFTEVINRKKDYHQAWYNRGLCKPGNAEAALNDFSEAIKIKPDYINALFQRGMIYSNQKKFNESLRDFEEIVKQDPGSDMAWFNIGLCNYNLRNIEAAINAFKKVLSINPADIDALYQVGYCYLEQKKYDIALEHFLEVASKKPDFININTSIGNVYYYNRDYERAIEFFTNQINLEQDLATAYGNRADAYRLLGDFENARNDLNKSFELDGESPYVYATRALLTMQTKKDESAFFSDLEAAVARKFPLYKHIAEEEDYLRFKNDARFQKLVEQSQEMALETQ